MSSRLAWLQGVRALLELSLVVGEGHMGQKVLLAVGVWTRQGTPGRGCYRWPRLGGAGGGMGKRKACT